MLRRIMLVGAITALIIGLLAPAASAGGEQVTLCHKPGTPAEGTLVVAASAVDAHLAHGDTLHECGWMAIADACTYLNALAQESVYSSHEPVTLDFVGDEWVRFDAYPFEPIRMVAGAATFESDPLYTCILGPSAHCWVSADDFATGPTPLSWGTLSGRTATWRVSCNHED